MRLKLTLAYDGRQFAGWQSQSGGNTIQDLIEHALYVTAKEPIRLHGSGRTDAGVHALAQIAHFDAPDHISMNPFNWVPALNTRLPAGIRVMACNEVHPRFHARFSSTGKVYQYDICTDPVLSPFRAGLAWHLPRQLDPETLREALALFQGRHNFQAFAANRGNETEETDYHRTVHEASLHAIEDGWRIRYYGEGFMYKMIRLMTGTAVHAAQGRLRLDDLAAYLDQPPGFPRGKSSFCAPSDGLTLVEVEYANGENWP